MDYHSSQLMLCDVRCFRKEQRGKIKPITLLVGENSTGKTTFLNCYSVLHEFLSVREVFSYADLDQGLDFNKEPFSMGSYRNIARLSSTGNRSVKKLKLGLTVSSSDSAKLPAYRLTATIAERYSQPILSSIHFRFDEKMFLEFRRNRRDEVDVFIPGYKGTSGLPFAFAMMVPDMYLNWLNIRSKNTKADDEPENFKQFAYFFKSLSTGYFRHSSKEKGAHDVSGARSSFWPPFHHKLVAMAPVRSKPERTYNITQEIESAEGSHIPLLMMRLAHAKKANWNALRAGLVEFGESSGLFSDIDVKHLGDQISDPFQLQLKVRAGQPANIMDVGYGISQSLPILVDVLSRNPSSRRSASDRVTYLLQQPEVHLHPRSQAQLASFFVESHQKHGHRFMIETHSDYIIDRVRIAVKKNQIQSDDVSILYFEPNGINDVKIHNISLDKNGNLKGVPEGYRDFFGKETNDLLGFND